MTDIEVLLIDFGEIAIRDIAKLKNSQGFKQRKLKKMSLPHLKSRLSQVKTQKNQELS